MLVQEWANSPTRPHLKERSEGWLLSVSSMRLKKLIICLWVKLYV
jgi:hypothetical protein